MTEYVITLTLNETSILYLQPTEYESYTGLQFSSNSEKALRFLTLKEAKAVFKIATTTVQNSPLLNASISITKLTPPTTVKKVKVTRYVVALIIENRIQYLQTLEEDEPKLVFTSKLTESEKFLTAAETEPFIQATFAFICGAPLPPSFATCLVVEAEVDA